IRLLYDYRLNLDIAIIRTITNRIAYIRQKEPLSMQGEVLGYNTSLRFLGNVIGPLLGGFLSGLFGISAVFFVTSGLLILSGLIMLGTWLKHENDGHLFLNNIKMRNSN